MQDIKEREKTRRGNRRGEGKDVRAECGSRMRTCGKTSRVANMVLVQNHEKTFGKAREFYLANSRAILSRSMRSKRGEEKRGDDARGDDAPAPTKTEQPAKRQKVAAPNKNATESPVSPPAKSQKVVVPSPAHVPHVSNQSLARPVMNVCKSICQQISLPLTLREVTLTLLYSPLPKFRARIRRTSRRCARG